MLKKIVCFIAAILMMTGCSGKSKLVGTWVGDSTGDHRYKITYFVFSNDGTYYSSDDNQKGSYEINGNDITLEGFIADDINATFRFDGEYLVLDYWGMESYYRKDN